MTTQIFMWYVFPILVGLACFGWIGYDKYIKNRSR